MITIEAPNLPGAFSVAKVVNVRLDYLRILKSSEQLEKKSRNQQKSNKIMIKVQAPLNKIISFRTLKA